MNKNIWVVLGGLAIGATWITVARAGMKSTIPVVINSAARSAKGLIGSARNSADATQYIGCSMEAADGANPVIKCFASSSGGTVVTCSRTTVNPPIGLSVNAVELGFLSVASSISNDSYLQFNWDSTGKCTRIFVENSSDDEVKKF